MGYTYRARERQQTRCSSCMRHNPSRDNFALIESRITRAICSYCAKYLYNCAVCEGAMEKYYPDRPLYKMEKILGLLPSRGVRLRGRPVVCCENCAARVLTQELTEGKECSGVKSSL